MFRRKPPEFREGFGGKGGVGWGMQASKGDLGGQSKGNAAEPSWGYMKEGGHRFKKRITWGKRISNCCCGGKLTRFCSEKGNGNHHAKLK